MTKLDYADLGLNPEAPNLKGALSTVDAFNAIIKASQAAQAPAAPASAPAPSLPGGIDLGKILALLPTIAALVQFISQLLPKAQPQAPAEPAPSPLPVPTPTPTPAPSPLPVPAPTGSRRITRWGVVKYHGFLKDGKFVNNAEAKGL